MSKRVLLVVLDSVGVGELPDAAAYGDAGSNTLGNIAKYTSLKLPNLKKMGLGNIVPLAGIDPQNEPEAAYGKMAELSPGKDTVTGHWEIAGIVLEKPLRTFPHGFPPELIKQFEKNIGRTVLGNKVASGTEIIQELGEKHLQTGSPIVYTSADSVFQIAAHEEVLPLQELYRICGIARSMLRGEWAVGRIIARPFLGTPGNFQRTANRQDFSLDPPSPTMLDLIQESGLEVVGVGKIGDIFNQKGLTTSIHILDNMDGINKTISAFQSLDAGLVFTNLVDYDSKYGHRNDPLGYARALEYFDQRLPEILHIIQPEDVLIITADHGCDPTTPSTDHSREYVPLLIYGRALQAINLGIRKTFADLGATITAMLGVKPPANGQSMYEMLLVGDIP